MINSSLVLSCTVSKIRQLFTTYWLKIANFGSLPHLCFALNLRVKLWLYMRRAEILVANYLSNKIRGIATYMTSVYQRHTADGQTTDGQHIRWLYPPVQTIANIHLKRYLASFYTHRPKLIALVFLAVDINVFF